MALTTTTDAINRKLEERDMNINVLHSALTNINNAKVDAFEAGDEVEYARLQARYREISEQLDRAMSGRGML